MSKNGVILECTEIERLWFMKSRADLEDEEENSGQLKHEEPQLTLSKSLLDHTPHIRFTTKFKVQQIGIFCKWVLDWIVEDAPTDFELLYEEAVPLLISSQHQINDGTATTTTINNGDTVSLSAAPSAASGDTNSGNKFDFPAMMRRSSSRLTAAKMSGANSKESSLKPPAKLKKRVWCHAERC